jgi:hypothetical protein
LKVLVVDVLEVERAQRRVVELAGVDQGPILTDGILRVPCVA